MTDSDDAEALVGDLRRAGRDKKPEFVDPNKTPPELLKLQYLLIDDERPMRTLVKNALNTYGIRTLTEAVSVEDALPLLEQKTFDVILVDEEMPGMGGAEFTFRLRRNAFPIDRKTPVIMITSHIEQDHVHLARKAGITEFLAKPVSAMALYKRLISAVLHPRPFVEDDDGYIGPERRWKNKNGEDKIKPTVEVLDFNAIPVEGKIIKSD